MRRRSETDRKHVLERRAEPRSRAHDSYAALRELAEAGDAAAQYALGRFCAARARPRRAARWYALAASQELPEAMYALSLCYLHGEGVARSLAASRRWAERCERLLGRDAASERSGAAHPVSPPPLLRASDARGAEARFADAQARRVSHVAGERARAAREQGTPARSTALAASNSGNVSPLRLAVSAWP